MVNMENEVSLCGIPACVEMGPKFNLFPTQFSENRWKIEYLDIEIDYNTQIST